MTPLKLQFLPRLASSSIKLHFIYFSTDDYLVTDTFLLNPVTGHVPIEILMQFISSCIRIQAGKVPFLITNPNGVAI